MNSQQSLMPNLKKYLSDVLHLEQALFTARQIKEEMQRQIEVISNAHEIEMPQSPVRENLFLMPIAIIGGGFILGAVFGLFFFPIWGTFIKWCVIISSVLASVVFYSTLSDNKDNQRDYESQKRNTVEEINRITAEQPLILAILNEKQAEVDKFVIETQSILDTLYNLNIIGAKYRHFVAIASICEYFVNDICFTLGADTVTGHIGAYAMYDKEVRDNIIIEKLGIIIENLQEIRDTQYLLYEAINETNQILQEIAGKLSGIKTATIVTAAVSIATAYYARQSAKNTSVLVDYRM